MKGLRAIKATSVRSAVWLIKIAVTGAALFILIDAIPWRDRAVLHDGASASILRHEGESCLIQAEGEPIRLRKSDLQAFEPGVLTLLGQVKPVWLLAYAMCAACIAALLITRWRFLMSDFENSPSLRWCSVIWARSQVINLLPLSQLGGDAYRAERSSHCLDNTTAAIGVIATERIVGLGALLVIALIGLSASGLYLGSAVSNTTILVVLGFVATICALLAVRRWATESDGARRGESFSERIRSIISPLRKLTRQPRSFVLVLILSIGAHLLSALTYFTVDRALGLGAPAWCYLIAVPALSLAKYFPVHIAGIGILEGGLWLFVGPWVDFDAAEVMAVCAGIRILGLFWLALLAISFLWPVNPKQQVAQPIGHDAALIEISVSSRGAA